jgi:putative MATE family efflux protein
LKPLNNLDIQQNTNSGILSDKIDEDCSLCLDAAKISHTPLLPKELRKSIISFAWPCLLELLFVSMISIVNLMMVGHLGAYAISAVGLTTQPVFIGFSLFMAFNSGSTALITRFIGSKDYSLARKVVSQTLIFSFFLGIILSVLGVIFSKWIVLKMGAQADTLKFADIYMKYMSLGLFFQAIPIAISALLRGVGDTKTPMFYNIIANVLNVILSFIFINGFFLIPPMGVEGAGIASLIAKGATFFLSIFLFFRGNLEITIPFRALFMIDFNMLKRVINIGMGAAGEQFVLRIGLIIFSKIVADLGTIAFAAHQIGLNILSLTYNIGYALGITATSFTGISLGEQRPEEAEHYDNEIRKIGMLISALLSVILLIFSKYIISWYTPDKEVIDNASQILRIFALILPAQTSQLIIAGGLRGAGDTKWPLISTMCGILGVRIVLAVILVNVFKMGLPGAWVAVAVDQIVRSLLIYLRYKKGHWKEIKV